MKKAPLSWKFKQTIGHKTFIIYENGQCRIDDNKKFKTYYYKDGNRLKWWDQYQKEIGSQGSFFADSAMDKAWMSFIGWQ